MEDQVLDILESLVQGRNEFFRRTVQLTHHASRPQILSRYMLNEVVYLELVNRIYTNILRSRDASAVVTFTIPANFSDPVTVSPSQEQIAAALEDIPTSTNNCAICQDAISSGACRIRHCQHEFHRSCLTNWLSMSVRCPVCRYDIRDRGDDASQTQTDEE